MTICTQCGDDAVTVERCPDLDRYTCPACGHTWTVSTARHAMQRIAAELRRRSGR